MNKPISKFDFGLEAASTVVPSPAPDIPQDRDFDWVDDRADLVIHEQPATAVYISSDGTIVIRQHRWPDEDAVVHFRPENLTLLRGKIAQFGALPLRARNFSLKFARADSRPGPRG